MPDLTKQNPIPKAIALVVASLGVAWVMVHYDISALAKIDSMSAADYVQKQRELHHHSFVFHFLIWLVMGGFYIGVIEFFAYVIGLLFKKKTNA